MSATQPPGEKGLTDLLTELFNARSLRRWIRHTFGEALYAELPGEGTSYADLVFQTMLLVRQHGRVDEAFESLLKNRPGHATRIQQVQRMWLDGAGVCVTRTGTSDNQETYRLTRELHEAIERKRRLDVSDGATDDVRKKILALKRRIRQGGQLHGGDIIRERYELLAPIGHGGFASVWACHDRESGDRVALKVLHPEHASDVVRRQQFLRGARMMAELDHPSVIRLREQGGEDAGFYYFVMDFAPGGNLQDGVLEARISRTQAIQLATQVGGVLVALHARGWVHRDVKPTNILLTENQQPRLTDFDLIMTQDTTGGTKAAALDTFIYAAPEMMEHPQDADARADVYGLGMTTMFILHGARLPRAALINRYRFIEALNCEKTLKDVLKRATAEERGDRYENASALLYALQAAELHSTDEQVQIAALSRVASRRAHTYHDAVVEVLESSASTAVRERAAWALDNLNDHRSKAALLAALDDPAFSVRSTAGWALVHLGNVIRADVEHLADNTTNPEAREMAQLILERLPARRPE